MISARTFFNIEPNETKLVTLVFLQSFLLGLPQLFTASAAGALFLSSYGAEELPWAYLASALTLPVIGLFLLGLQKKATGERVLRVIFLFLIAGLAVLYLLFLLNPRVRYPRLLLLIWVDIEYTLTEMAFWLHANSLFNVRQAKRLFGVVGAGQVTAALAGGVLLPILAPVIGIGNMFLFSLAGSLLGYLNFLYIGRACPAPAGAAQTRELLPGRPGGSAGRQYRPYIVLIFCLVALEYLTHYVLDVSFYRRAGESLHGSPELASFIALFLAAAGISKILVKSLVSARWLKRFGIGGSLATPALMMVLPVALALAAGLLPAGANGAVFIFFCLTAARFAETLAVSSLYAPAYFTLYQPLGSRARSQAQNIADTVVGQASGGIAGLCILGLQAAAGKNLAAGFNMTLVLLLVLLGIWFRVALRTGKKFNAEASANLIQRGIQGSTAVAVSEDSVPVLLSGLGSRYPGTALYAMEKLAGLGRSGLEPELAPYLDHPDGRVRQNACRIARSIGLSVRPPAESPAERAEGFSDAGTEPPERWEHAFENLLSCETRNEALRLFEDGNADAVDFLERKYCETAGGDERKILIIRALAVIRDGRSEELLLSLCSETDRNIYHQVLLALSRRRFRFSETHREFLDNCLAGELKLGRELKFIRDFLSGTSEPLILEALQEELRKSEERIFLLLTFRYPPGEVLNVWTTLNEADAAGRAFALDILDSLLSEEHRKLILPYLETGTGAATGKPAVLREKEVLPFLRAVHRRAAYLGLRWLSVSALYVPYRNGIPQYPAEHRVLEAELPLIERVRCLREAPIFRGIPDENLYELAHDMRLLPFRVGSRIITRNEQGSTMYIIRKGSVRVHDDTHDIAVFREGDIFGELSALSPEPRSAHITAVTAVQVLEISGPAMYDFLERRFRTTLAILKVLSGRIRDTERRIEGTAAIAAARPPLPADGAGKTGGERSVRETRSALEAVMALKSFDLLMDVPEEVLHELSGHVRERSVPAGAVLFEEGSEDHNLYLVYEGRIELTGRSGIISSFGAREVLGENQVLDPGTAPLRAQASEPSTVFILERTLVNELLWDNFSVTRGLILRMTGRLRTLTRK